MAITSFPKDPESYSDMLEHIAKIHPSIAHMENDEVRFCNISQSMVPFDKWDIKEFTTGQANKFKNLATKFMMVAVDLDEDKIYVNGPQNDGQLNGSFILLKKATPKNNDYSEIKAVKNEAFIEGKRVLAWIGKFMRINKQHGNFIDAKAMSESVGPVERHLYGYRFYFSWRIQQQACTDGLPAFTEQPTEL